MPLTMSLDELASWSTIVQSVFVVISLVFIWLQLRQSTELAKAANAQSLVEHASSFNAMLIQDKEVARLWYSNGQGLDKPSDIQRYRELITQWLIFHENIYYQYSKGLLDKQAYTPWREELKFFALTQNLDLITKDFELYSPGGFGKHILELRKGKLNLSYQPEIKKHTKK